MIKKLLFLAAGAMTVASCAKLESDSLVFENLADNCESISIPIVNEGVETATKAYYYEDSSYWTYLWEDRDIFNYFYYSRADYLGKGTANVNKSTDATLVSYAASNLAVGNTIYSYFLQKDLWLNQIPNDDPNAVKLIIPTNQVTTKTPEKFRNEINCAFSVTNLSLLNQTATGELVNGVYASIPDNILSFTITNFNPSLKEYYKCKVDSDNGSVSDFTIDDNGNASLTVSFARYGSSKQDQFTTVKIYLSDGDGTYDGNFVCIKVNAHRTSDSSWALDGSGLVSIYSCEVSASGSAKCYENLEGAKKPYPIRDAMPCASRGKLITSSLLQYPEDIANSMTMYMLGSAAEFRIYSSTGRYQGEDILKVIFTTSEDDPCAGYCYYDIESESLAITGYDEYQIVSDVESCGYKVPRTKLGEESVYMVLAPGTYDATIEVVTKDSDGELWEYKFQTSNQTFTRANRKPFGVNLESANAKRIPYDPTGSTSVGDEDEM